MEHTVLIGSGEQDYILGLGVERNLEEFHGNFLFNARR